MSSQKRYSVSAVRRAVAADAGSMATRFPALPPPSFTAGGRAAFLIDGESGLAGAINLEQGAGHLLVDGLAVSPACEHAGIDETLIAFAEITARAIGLHEVRLGPGVLSPDLARSRGYRGGIKSISAGRLARMLDHLELVGVPPWRDGAAPLDLTLYYRGVWAAMALLIGFGSITLAVFGPGEVTLLRVVIPAALCLLSSIFAVWQVGLIAMAARRSGHAIVVAGTMVAAILAIAAIGGLLRERAMPSIAELWAIYTGDEELGDLAVSVSADGSTLRVEGAYGTHSADAVRRALDQHPALRRVVLAGPGGRIGTALDIYRMIRNRRLATRVETACASACTIAFLGGIDRSISPVGRLGFHQGSFPGMGPNDLYESNRDMRRFLVSNGITPAFAQRVLDTPPDEIWTPTPEELLAGRVVQRVNR